MTPGIDRLVDLLVASSINFAGAIATAVIGWWLAGVVERWVRRALLGSAYLDQTVAGFLASVARYGLLVLVFIAVLQLIGIQATSLIAIVGAASLAIGLALQGTLSNMAAGVMLLIFRPFRAGDHIEVGGKSGKVVDLNIFMTELATSDHVKLLVPNSQVWGVPLTNFSAYPTCRVNVNIPVALERDVDRLCSSVHSFLNKDERVLVSPPPVVTIANLTEKTVELAAQAWCKTDDAEALRADLLRHIPTLIRQIEAPAPPATSSFS